MGRMRSQDKTLMMETYDRGEIQLMEKTCHLDAKQRQCKGTS